MQNNPDWHSATSSTTGQNTNLYLKDPTSGNTIKYIGIKSELSLLGAFSTTKDTNNNTIILNNVEVDTSDIPGGANHVIGGYTTNGHNANNNTVIIKDSTIKNAHIFGGDSHNGDACGNTVIIDNSKIINTDPDKDYNIYGGFAFVPNKNLTTNTSGMAENNTVIIKKGSELENINLFGGFLTITDVDDLDSLTAEDFKKVNNTLILDDWSGSVKKVRSFDNIKFKNVDLSDFINNTSNPILTITGEDENHSFENVIGADDKIIEIDSSYTKPINIDLSFQGGQDIKAGETIRLVQMNETGDAIVDDAGGKKIKLANGGVSYAGVAQKLVGELYFDEAANKYIDYKIKSVELNEQANVVNEGRAAAAAFLWQGDELISEALGQLNVEDKYGFETFAMVYGNDSRYGGTAHDLSINGWSGLVGVGSNNKTKAGDLAWAVYFENGYGNYDVTTSMNGISLDGDGSAVYNGGGIAARLTGDNGVYGEASLRAGLLKNDLDHGKQNGEQEV